MDDGIAAAEIAKQIAALRPRVHGSGGVMAYLEKPKTDQRADVNKTFLASTIRGVASHNRRQEEDKCWTLRRVDDKLGDRRRAGGQKRRRSRSRSRSQSSSRHRERYRSSSRRREERSSSGRSRSRDRRSRADAPVEKKEDEDERSYWARKKAEKTRALWEKLHSEGTVSVENAPDYSAEESDDDDVKPTEKPSSPVRKEKKHKKHSRKSDKKEKRRRSRS